LFVVPETIFPVPCVNPDVPHSTFHEVAEPFSNQPKLAEIAVTAVVVNKEGSGQAGASLISTSSITFALP